MAEGAHSEPRSHTTTHAQASRSYRLALTAPAAIWLGLELARAPAGLHPAMLQWVVLLAVAELVATEAWGGPGLSVAFGIQVTVAMLFEPVAAGLIAFAGAFDPRALRGQMRPLHDLSHRCLALSVVAIGSAGFHGLAGGIDDRLARLVPAWALVTGLMYFAFLGAELLDRMLSSGRPARELLHEMDRVSPYRFPMTFPGLGWFSLAAARLGQVEGLWPVVVIFGLTAYGRWVCLKAWTLKARVQERNRLLDSQARELAVHLYREQRTVAELEELSRLKSQLVAVASHEVRTPLTSIIGYAGALRRLPAGGEADRRQEFADIIERQARRLLGLVERLLTASRLESGKLVTTLGSVRLRELCHEVVEGVGADRGRVVVDVPDDLPDPVTDRRFLAQVLGNLVENALKYSPRDRPCTLGARRDGQHLVVWVEDRGIGIPDSELRRIFERFYQVERAETRRVGGVGLGLTLVRELVEILGGTIAVESGVGQGSRFTVTLPLRHPAAGSGGRGSEAPTRAPGREAAPSVSPPEDRARAGRTTNGPRTKGADSSIQPIGDPGMPPIRRRSGNL